MDRSSTLAAAVIVATASFLTSGPFTGVAGAATSCSFDEGTHVVTVVFDAGSHTLDRSGSAIRLDGSACGTATVTTTDIVQMTGAAGATLTIDLSGGPFAPGATDEGDGSSEIELTVELEGAAETGLHIGVAGTEGADHVLVGRRDIPGTFFTDAIDLNADETVLDADVYTQNGMWADVTVDGLGGDDDLRGYFPCDGDDGVLPAFFPVTIDAGPGDDTLGWWAYGGELNGGEGRDLIDDTLVGDRLSIWLAEGEILGGTYRITASNLEDAIGGLDDDLIVAGSGGATIAGGAGDDDLFGSEAADVIDGGSGWDQVYAFGGDDHLVGGGDPLDVVGFTEPVTVDLEAGTATGEGNDTLDGFHVIWGSASNDTILGATGDDVLRGFGGADDLHGRRGDDQIYGGAGDDHLLGGRGQDALLGERADDSLNGGHAHDLCDGGLGTHDTSVRCEDEANVPRHAASALAGPV